MRAEKIGTACFLTALMLAWFLVLDVLEVRLELSLLGWAAVAPFLLQPLLGRLTRATERHCSEAAELAGSRRAAAMLRHAAGEAERPLMTIVESCDRLQTRCRAEDLDFRRVSQEAAAIHHEAVQVREILSAPPRTAGDVRATRPLRTPLGRLTHQDRRTAEGA